MVPLALAYRLQLLRDCLQPKNVSSLQVLSVAGAYAKEEVCRTLVVHISNAPKLHAYAARQAFHCLQEHQKDANLLLLTTTAWLLGRILSPPPLPPGATPGLLQWFLLCLWWAKEVLQNLPSTAMLESCPLQSFAVCC